MSVYKFVELVGTSTESWEKAAAIAVEIGAKSLGEPRIAEVEKLDLQVVGEQINYRAKLKVSFKVEAPTPRKKRS